MELLVRNSTERVLKVILEEIIKGNFHRVKLIETVSRKTGTPVETTEHVLENLRKRGFIIFSRELIGLTSQGLLYLFNHLSDSNYKNSGSCQNNRRGVKNDN